VIVHCHFITAKFETKVWSNRAIDKTLSGIQIETFQIGKNQKGQDERNTSSFYRKMLFGF